MQIFTQVYGGLRIIVGEQAYVDSSDNFKQDYGSEVPELPPQFTCREYVPGVRHTFKVATDVVDGGPMPWPEGDQILKAIDRLVERANARRKRKEDEQKAKIQAEVDAANAKILAEIKEKTRQMEEERKKIVARAEAKYRKSKSRE